MSHPYKVCNRTFESRGNLKTHKKEEHQKKKICKYCEETFEQTYKLEKHLEGHKEKEFECTTCGKIFQLEWRLKKHHASHDLKTLKKCHYFNNGKLCPFEEIGCMFLHVLSPKCIFNRMCKNKMCPYQHDNHDIIANEIESNNSDNLDICDTANVTNDGAGEAIEEEINVDSDSENEDLECDLCGKIFANEDDLAEHESSDDNCGYGCDDCGAYYREEIHLKMHLERHCTKCFDEFPPKNMLEAHKKSCYGLQY